MSVTTGDGRAFQYFHIVPVVAPGESVSAYRTVLGYVRAPWQHVHLTEIDDFRAHNPLDPGHLEPYHDHTVPTIEQLSFTASDDRSLDPRHLHGSVSIVADASDTTALPVPGHWLGFPVTPAFVAFRLLSSRGVVIKSRVAADFRFREPLNRDFWSLYAEGTYQNFPDFVDRFYWHLPGRYLFNLTATPLDTRRLRNGSYQVTVVAADTCGNKSTATERISIDNRHSRSLAARTSTGAAEIAGRRTPRLDDRPVTSVTKAVGESWRVAFIVMGVPAGSCAGTGGTPVPMSLGRDNAGRRTGICPVCHGRLRVDADELLPNHAPAPSAAGTVRPL